MKLQIISKNNSRQPAKLTRGFTLIEILVTIGIITMLFVVRSFINIDSYKRGLLNTEQATLISSLQRARSRAMNNVYASRHGVHIENDSYVIFREFPYNESESTNEGIIRNKNISILGLDEVIFEQLSGETNNDGTITFSDEMGTKEIKIFKNGLIDW